MLRGPKKTKYEFLGWPVSPYSMKTRAYLRFKRISFHDRQPSVLELNTSIKRVYRDPEEIENHPSRRTG